MAPAGDQCLACKSCRPSPCLVHSLLAQQLAGQVVDEMQSMAGGADDRPVGAFGLVVGWQPMPHVHPGLGAFVNDRARHGRQYDDAGEG